MKFIIKLLLTSLLLYFFCHNERSDYLPKIHVSNKYRMGHAHQLHYQLLTYSCTQNAQRIFKMCKICDSG